MRINEPLLALMHNMLNITDYIGDHIKSHYSNMYFYLNTSIPSFHSPTLSTHHTVQSYHIFNGHNLANGHGVVNTKGGFVCHAMFLCKWKVDANEAVKYNITLIL